MLRASSIEKVQFELAGSTKTKVFVQWTCLCSRLTPLNTTKTELIILVLKCHCVIFELLGVLKPSENIATFYITICGTSSK